MIEPERNLPLSTVALVFGALSIPLMFARHLVSLALVLALLALVFGLWGRRSAVRHPLRYTPTSRRRSKWAVRTGAVGAIGAMIIWMLWASNVLLH